VGFAGAGSDGERLQHLRSVLPCRVQVTASMHPLFGELLAATGFKRWNGVPLLVVTRPDGSRGTIRADATDIFATDSVEPTCRVLAGPGAAPVVGGGADRKYGVRLQVGRKPRRDGRPEQTSRRTLSEHCCRRESSSGHRHHIST
jgi:hypothetical protein